jgi:hypothetical protein
MNATITLKGITYKVVGRHDAHDLPNTRVKMDENGIRGYIYLQRLRGKNTYMGVEYVSGSVSLI